MARSKTDPMQTGPGAYPVLAQPRPTDGTTSDQGWEVVWFDDDSVRNALPRTVLVSTEHVRLIAVYLPIASRRQREEAAPFAIEEQIAEPIADTHVTVGPQIGENRYLVAAVSRQVMAEWGECAAAQGLKKHRIVPDVFRLITPPPGSWMIEAQGGRVLVRTDDGGGFAAGAQLFAPIWTAAGKPHLISADGAGPTGVSVTCAPEAQPNGIDAVAANFDLRGEAFASGKGGGLRLVKRLSAIAAIGVILHLTLLALDVWGLRKLEDTRREDAAALVQGQRLATLPTPGIIQRLNQLVPTTGEPTAEDGFLAMMSDVSRSLLDRADGLSMRRVTWRSTDGALGMFVTTSDLNALQAISADLQAAGFAIESGAGTVADGAAEAQITVRRGALTR